MFKVGNVIVNSYGIEYKVLLVGAHKYVLDSVYAPGDYYVDFCHVVNNYKLKPKELEVGKIYQYSRGNNHKYKILGRETLSDGIIYVWYEVFHFGKHSARGTYPESRLMNDLVV